MAAYVGAFERVESGGQKPNPRRFEQLIGKSRSLEMVLGQVERVAPIDSTVLIQGKTGTGKELIARGSQCQLAVRTPLYKAHLRCDSVCFIGKRAGWP